MDKKILEQYGSIKREIEDLKNRRARLLSSVKEMPVADTVSSSSRSIPYAKRIIAITGTVAVMSESKAKKLADVEKRLAEKELELYNEYTEVESFLDSVKDSDTRRIIRYKYIDRLPWVAVAKRVYGEPTESRARMKINRLFT